MNLTEIGRLGHWVDLTKLNKDSVIIDAGACSGEFIEEIRKMVNCKIIAIEPDIDSFKTLEGKNFDNVELHNNALVGNGEPELSTFYSYPLKELGNIFNLYPGSFGGNIVKNIKTQDLPTADYIKMDIEGAEKLLLEDKIDTKQISIEVHNNCNADEIIKKLEEQGFSCQKMPRSEVYGFKE